MGWIKRTKPVEEEATPTAVAEETPVEEQEAAPSPELTEEEQAAAERDRAFEEAVAAHPLVAKKENRRATAVLGLVVLVFAVIGVIATVVSGLQIIRRARDTSYLKEDMYYTLLPLMQYAPKAFEAPDESKQDALIQAALYEITNREWIRSQQDASYVSPYEVDEFGRTIVPIKDVTAAYNKLFGADTIPYCHTFGDDAGSYFTYEYDADSQLYYVPYSDTASAYNPVIDTIQRAGDLYRVRVGYVHVQDTVIDDHGNQLTPLEKATYFQIYSVERLEDGSFVIRAVADEETDTTK